MIPPARIFARMRRTGLMIAGLGASLAFGTQAAAQSPDARVACQSIDDLQESIALHRTLQNGLDAARQADRQARLDHLLRRISLPALASTETVNMPALQDGLIATYLSDLRAGNPTRTPSKLGTHVQTLEQVWNCATTAPAGDADTSDAGSRSLGASSDVSEGAASRNANPIPGDAGGRDRISTSRSLNRAQTGTSLVMQPASLAMTSLFIFVLVVLTIILRRRAKSFTIREQRKLLHKPVAVRLGKSDYEMVLVDISMNGFKIQHPGLIRRQRKLRVWLNGRWHIGRIRWTNNLFAGVLFAKPIDKATFDAVIQ